MNDFIESFFDSNDNDFKLWSKNISEDQIQEKDIIYRGEMFKINRKNNKTKLRYFVLTKDNLYYLKSPEGLKVRGVMSTEWVRI